MVESHVLAVRQTLVPLGDLGAELHHLQQPAAVTLVDVTEFVLPQQLAHRPVEHDAGRPAVRLRRDTSLVHRLQLQRLERLADLPPEIEIPRLLEFTSRLGAAFGDLVDNLFQFHGWFPKAPLHQCCHGVIFRTRLYPDKHVVKLMFWVTVGGTVAGMARDKCHADSFIHAIWSIRT
jgi:hypothetical protein